MKLKELIKKEGLRNPYFGLSDKKTGERLSDKDDSVQEIKDKILKGSTESKTTN